ncbi:MAG: PulJ/GspJ family protein [Bdellovibrionota bacterium]
MSKNRIKAFTMTELLVSTALAGLVLAGTMTIYGSLQRKEIEASLQSEFRSISKQIEKGILNDIQNAVRFSDIEGEMLGVSTAAVGDKLPDLGSSDVLGMMIIDPKFSTAESYRVTKLEFILACEMESAEESVCGEAVPKIYLEEDPEPLATIEDDFFILKRGKESVLIKRRDLTGVMAVEGASMEDSMFEVYVENGYEVPYGWSVIDSSNPIQLFRVVLTYYRIGNGSLTSGLYRSQGRDWESIKDNPSAWQQISNRVDSLQARYWFSDINGTAEADCLESTISGSRKPLLAGTNCQWEHLASMRVEFSLVSDQEIFSATAHPHKTLKSKTLKYLHLISSAPKNELME